LIPSLSDPNAAMVDNFLVATVILRLLEEFDNWFFALSPVSPVI
jgi:hypothetical protein